MERPTCRLCGARHYAREPHVFATTAGGQRNITESKSGSRNVTEAGKLRVTVTELQVRIDELEGKLSAQREANARRVKAFRASKK